MVFGACASRRRVSHLSHQRVSAQQAVAVNIMKIL